MTIITGTADFQDGFQGLLHEQTSVGGKAYAMPITKLSADSSVEIHGGLYISSGTISQADNSMVSVLNSFDGVLGANQIFSGTFENVVPYGGIRISIYTTVQSATGGLQMWCSKDGENGFAEDSYTIRASTPKTYAVTVSAPYFKVIFTNGSSQANVKICVMYQKNVSIPSSHRIGNSVTDDDDAQLVQAVLKAQRPGGDYTNIDATNGGNLKVSIEEIDPAALPLSVLTATGSVVGTFGVDGFGYDSFGRLRTSEPANRFDVEFNNDHQPLVMERITAGGASIVYSTGTRDVVLSVASTTGSASAIFPSHIFVPYTPGNSQLIEITGTMDYAQIGSGTASIVLRNNGSETEWQQNEWLYPQGASTINWKYSQILAIDFQSLKVGRLRIGFVRNGIPTLVHEIYNDNKRANGYWQRPGLPPFWKIYNSGSFTISEMGYGNENNGIFLRHKQPANALAKSLAICATVKSEGGKDFFDLPGFPFSFGNQQNTKTVAATKIPLCSIRVETPFKGITNRSLIIPDGISFITDNPIYYEVILNPLLSGSVFGQIDSESSVFGDVSAVSYSGGTVIFSDYAGAGGTRSAAYNSGFTGKIPMSVNYLGTGRDTITIVAVRVGAVSAFAGATIRFREIR